MVLVSHKKHSAKFIWHAFEPETNTFLLVVVHFTKDNVVPELKSMFGSGCVSWLGKWIGLVYTCLGFFFLFLLEE